MASLKQINDPLWSLTFTEKERQFLTSLVRNATHDIPETTKGIMRTGEVYDLLHILSRDRASDG